MEKLVVSTQGANVELMSEEDISQRETDFRNAEEKNIIESLIPDDASIEQAEFELKTLTLLMEVGLL